MVKAFVFIILVLLLCIAGIAAFIWLLYENNKATTISPFCLRQACSNSEPNQLTPAVDPEARSFIHLNYCYSNLPTVDFVNKIKTCSRGGNSKDFFAQNVVGEEGNITRIAYYSEFANYFFQPGICGYALPTGNNPTRDGDNNSREQVEFLDDIAKCRAVVES